MKGFILGTLLAAALLSNSQTPQFSPYFSAIIVSDVENSVEWYSQVFSAEVVARYDNEERGFKIVNLDAGNFLIELLELRDAKAKVGRSQGFFKTGFLVDDILTWEKHLKKLNVEFHGDMAYDEKIKKRMLIFKDPDGNYLQLFEDHE